VCSETEAELVAHLPVTARLHSCWRRRVAHPLVTAGPGRPRGVSRDGPEMARQSARHARLAASAGIWQTRL